MRETRFQIGKNGITEGTIDSLTLVFINHKQVRITVLKSSGRDRNSIIGMADEISKELSRKISCSFSYRIIGFTIIMKKHLKQKL